MLKSAGEVDDCLQSAPSVVHKGHSYYILKLSAVGNKEWLGQATASVVITVGEVGGEQWLTQLMVVAAVASEEGITGIIFSVWLI